MYRVEGLGKKYTGKNGIKWALKDVSFVLPATGLYGIEGKSGSGKSTLLNLLSGMESPSEGKIFFRGQDITKWKEKEKEDYRNFVCAFVFQHFHLEEEETALRNVMLPLEIRGDETAEKQAKALFDQYHLSYLESKLVKVLSGGEKQRVALLRALAGNPHVLFADEPTGALDHQNEALVMNALKELSKTKLVLLVSHNQRLLETYADGVLTLEAGKVATSTLPKEERRERTLVAKPERKKKSAWKWRIVKRNAKRNWTKNTLAFLSGLFGYAALLCSFGFYHGSQTTLETEKTNSFGYLCASFSKQEEFTLEHSPMKLVRSTCPSIEESEAALAKVPGIRIANDYSYFLPNYTAYSLNGYPKEPTNFVPVWDLSGNDRGRSFLKEGVMPKGMTFEACLVNEEYVKQCDASPLGKRIHFEREVTLSEGEATQELLFSYDWTIVGIVKEFSFLASPKIYYSYQALETVMKETELPSFGKGVTVSSYVKHGAADSPYTSYARWLFGEDEKAMEALFRWGDVAETSNSSYVVQSSAHMVNTSFASLTHAFALSLLPFLGITVLGVAFTEGAIAYHSFLQRRKEAAILSALGARKADLEWIYEAEPLGVNLLSALGALLLSYPLSWFLSRLFAKKLGLSSLVSIPYLSAFGIPFLPIVTLFLFALCLTFFGVAVPLHIANRKNLCEELREE